MCNSYWIQKKARKIRKQENERLENMTEEELLEDYKKTNRKASEYAEEHGIKTVLVTGDGIKDENSKDTKNEDI